MATSGKDFRLESDLIGERQISNEHLYGVQTLRGIENFNISNFHLCDYPLFIHGLAWTKEAAAIANHRLGLLTDQQKDAIVQACHELLEGKHHQHFPVDMIQGGRRYDDEHERERGHLQPCTRDHGPREG